MRIGIQSGGSITWLAGQAGVSERVHSSANDYALSGDRQLDVASFVQTDYTAQFDRLNQPNEVSFGTTRKFSSADDCFLFTLDYLDDFPLTGELIFEIEIPGGGTHRRQMANAVMQRPAMDPIGETLVMEYAVTGGRITVASGTGQPPGTGPGRYRTDTAGDFLTDTGGLYLTGT